jgi:hypothetical protein
MLRDALGKLEGILITELNIRLSIVLGRDNCLVELQVGSRIVLVFQMMLVPYDEGLVIFLNVVQATKHAEIDGVNILEQLPGPWRSLVFPIEGTASESREYYGCPISESRGLLLAKYRG